MALTAQRLDDPFNPWVLNGLQIELFRRGSGRPLLFLHPGLGFDSTSSIADLLAGRAELIAPSHPGFGRSQITHTFTTVDDLAYFYLDLMESLDLRDVVLVGSSFGAWIATEVAIKSTSRLSHLVLADALGIKIGNYVTRDIVDMFAITDDEFARLAYADPARARRDHASMNDADLLAIARNREAMARFGWSPYMHDPKLKGRLHRIDVPTLVLWGEQDRIVTPDYGRTYCASIPGARFELIANAGHFPHVEQPNVFADKIFAFVTESGRA